MEREEMMTLTKAKARKEIGEIKKLIKGGKLSRDEYLDEKYEAIEIARQKQKNQVEDFSKREAQYLENLENFIDQLDQLEEAL